MIFTRTEIEEAKKKYRKVENCKKKSDLKACLTDINEFLDDPSTCQVLEFIQNQVDEIDERCSKKNLVVAKDFEEIAKDMADEFKNQAAKSAFFEAVKILRYHPVKLKRKLISTYIQLKIEEKIHSLKNKEGGHLESIFFNVDPDHYKEKWKNEIEDEAEKMFRTDSVKTYEKQKEELDKHKKVLSDIKLLQSFKNNTGDIDKIHLSIKAARKRYDECVKLNHKLLNSVEEMTKTIASLPEPKNAEEQKDKKAALETINNCHRSLKNGIEYAEAILKNNPYSIDHLLNIISILHDTWRMFLSIMELASSLNSLKIESIKPSYTHGKKAASARLTFTINESNPVIASGKTARDLYKLLNISSKVLSEDSVENNRIRKNFVRVNGRVFKQWKKFGFAHGELELIHSDGYIHKIPQEIRRLIRK